MGFLELGMDEAEEFFGEGVTDGLEVFSVVYMKDGCRGAGV